MTSRHYGTSDAAAINGPSAIYSFVRTCETCYFSARIGGRAALSTTP
jgi:hypothetical protein